MDATFTVTKKGTWAYIQKSVRVNGRSTTQTIKRLGLLEDIQQREGCSDPRQWAIDLARKMTLEEKEGRKVISLDFDPSAVISGDDCPLRHAGDLFLLPLFNGLRLPEICRDIMKESRAKYNLSEILQTLVCGRILFPGSKTATLRQAAKMVNAPGFSESDIFRSLTLLADHINDIQAQVYIHSKDIMDRRERVIYYDCTNYFFEIEDNDKDYIDPETGEFVAGLRKRGKSKENRPNPIVQMGMFMDMDGIPLAFVIFPGNESEQTSLQPLEEILNRRFGMTDYVVSTDAGLASESNRRYNMAEGRDYITVQSIPSLKSADQDMAVATQGWRIACCDTPEHRADLESRFSDDGLFDLECLRGELSREPKLLGKTTFYKEIIVEKELKTENPLWLKARKESPDTVPADRAGKRIPRYLTSVRDERTIVTYSHDFAQYLAHKRQERVAQANKIIRNKQTKSRTSRQSPLNYVETVHKTEDGKTAVKIEMHLRQETIEQEERFDGFYAYGTSLDDDAQFVLRARSFHHEIEHLFRTTKTHLDARPVYLSRQDRIKSHFLICFLSMVILKILQRQLTEANKEYYRENTLSIDALIDTLRTFMFGQIKGRNYLPMYRRTDLTDQLQTLCGVQVNNQIISAAKMRAAYRKVKEG